MLTRTYWTVTTKKEMYTARGISLKKETKDAIRKYSNHLHSKFFFFLENLDDVIAQ